MMLGLYLGFWLVAIAILFVVIRKYTKKRDSALQVFASQHSLTYVPHPNAVSVVEPKLINAQRGIYDQMIDASNNSTFFCDSGAVQSGGGSGQSTDRFLGIRRLVSNQTSFVLAPNDGSTMRFFNTNSFEQVSFESDDLNKVYRLMTQPGQEVDALQMLSPNLLLWLAQNASNATIVMKSGSLYVYMRNRVVFSGDSESSYESQYALINSIGDYLMLHMPKAPVV
jgi:hypothetical protein